jgi:hypothetical protein
MHHRSRYRLSFPPFAIVTACAAVLVAIWIGPLGPLLERTNHSLPKLVIAVCALLPFAFLGWYLFSFADVRRTTLTVRSLFHASRLDLRTLVKAEVFAKPTPTIMSFLMGQGGMGVTEKQRRHELMLLLTDEEGRQVLLPLNAWRGEELLMARVLRATVERRVRIDGEPLLVRRFSGLLDSYRSWDRQQAAA